ncbi:hypothetical protein CDV50_16310 [Haematobacter massiliensis]|uniref:Uncharacterized protein n=1 Tax=Haematobacter massiliensis TaxID=195105 RepID=A0A086YB88_9RHOB|nr:hypothetical protein CN97_09010 [Haematobacter massiliensis]OWJ69665.1 hypothetical protein CDV50_16310 [Haematobacter massiliensis]
MAEKDVMATTPEKLRARDRLILAMDPWHRRGLWHGRGRSSCLSDLRLRPHGGLPGDQMR